MPDPANYKPLSEIDDKYEGLDTVIKNAITGEIARTQSAELMLVELDTLI